MMRFARVSLLLGVVLLFSVPALAREQLFVDVYLNSLYKGQFLGYLSNDRADFFLPVTDMAALGLDLRGEETLLDGVAHTSVLSLGPELTHEFNEKEIALYLMATPDKLGVTSLDLRRTPPGKSTELDETSAFLNYSITLNANEDRDYESLSLPFEGGLRLHNTLYYSNFLFSDTGEEEALTRLFTQVIKDDKNKLRRYIVGDFNPFRSELGGGVTMAGFQVAKNFSLDPYFLINPGLKFQGQLQFPSDVELWRNGTLLESQSLEPGNFEFVNVPATSGAGEVELVIRDAFGQEQRVVFPFYFSSTLLKQGLHEYDYNLGFKRFDYGSENFSYDDPVFIMSHRYGFSDFFTGGIRGEIDENLFSGGAEAAFVYGRYGSLSLAGAVSRFHNYSGTAASVGYSYSDNRYNVNLTYRVLSKDYSNLSLDPEDDRARNELLASASVNLRPWGKFSAFYTSSDQYEEGDTERLTLRYSKNLTQKLNLEIAASQIRTQTTENEVFVTLNYYFGEGVSLYSSAGKTGDQQSQSVTLQRNPPKSLGYGFRVQARNNVPDQGEDSQDYDAEISYYGQYGDYFARVRASDGTENYSLRTTGSLGVVNNSWHFGREVRNGFAIAKVGDLEGVEVYNNNSPVGKTNQDGEVFVPNMSSNYANRLSFNEQDLPLNYSYKDNEKVVSVPYRGGGYVVLDVKKSLSVFGRLFVQNKQDRYPAELWRLDLNLGQDLLSVPIGRGGDFYLEDLALGSYQATLVKGSTQCKLSLDIPESEDIFVDLGDVHCEMD